MLADCYLRTGQLDQAAGLVTWMEQFDREHELTEYAPRYLTAAQLSAALGDWPAAEAQLQLTITQTLKQSDMYALGNAYLYQRFGATRRLAEIEQLLTST